MEPITILTNNDEKRQFRNVANFEQLPEPVQDRYKSEFPNYFIIRDIKLKHPGQPRSILSNSLPTGDINSNLTGTVFLVVSLPREARRRLSS